MSGHPADGKRWVCPACRSAELRVFYSERRYAPIDQGFVDSVQPDYGASAFADGGLDINVICEGCGRMDVTPLRSRPLRFKRRLPVRPRVLSRG